MRIVLVCLVAVLTACSGELFLIESDNSVKCTTSVECGFRRACEQGVCVDAPWCACSPGQGCADGQCIDIVTSGNGANSCSPQRTEGLCPNNTACCHLGTVCCADTEVCVGDTCVPNDRPCSATEPNGWCGPDLACVQGNCQLLDQCLCSATNTNGCCRDGAVCQNGACVDQACSATEAGTCAVDYVCTTSGCSRLPCGPGHTNGSCTSGFCSASGACIPSGTCAARGDCALNQYCGADSACHTQGTCQDSPDCVIQFGEGYSCIGGTCTDTAACHSNSDCGSSQYCSTDGYCVANGCCGADGDCSGSGQSCVDRGACDTCITRGTCEQATDCPPSFTCDLASGTCNPTGTTCNSNDFTANCAPGVLSCCAPGGTCCSNGQRCSNDGRCIPFGHCVDSTDCLSGFTCSNFVCIPAAAAACPCASGEHCADIPLPGGNFVSGCVPNTNCSWSFDCPSGFRCNAEYTCELDPQCGDLQLTTGSFVPPNVLIVFDRSASMNLCGVGDPSVGYCGYNFGACSGDTDCNGFDAKAVGGNMPCVTFGAAGKVCVDSACNYDCLNASCAPAASDPPAGSIGTETRWSEAITAIDTLLDAYVNEVSFGLSLFPKSPSTCATFNTSGTCATAGCTWNAGTSTCGAATCGTDCNWFSCTDKSNLTAGVVDIAVGSGTHDAIVAALNAAVPGGSTPSAATLRGILALGNHGGLNAIDRADAIVLVTDGDPTGDTQVVKTCEPPCTDGVKNGDETGVDCGGQCGGCALLTACVTGDDCLSHICRDNKCRDTTCTNTVQDAPNETGVDCGGTCQACADGGGCSVNADCLSHICGTGSTCVAPLCTDSVLNGSETGVDCGGSCSTACADGIACLSNSDCVNGFCDPSAHVCKPAHCHNSTTDAGETGVDCGGACSACATLCTNGQLDAGETDIDCGGSSCPACGGAKTCSTNTDCLSNGHPNGGCTTCGGTASSSDQICAVNAAIDRLYAANPRVKTFVVGFENSGSKALNCNAVHGKTANRAVAGCDTLTRTTCSDVGAPTCYYDAGNATALQTALNDVIQQVSSCRFALAQQPPDSYNVSVYLEDPAHPETRTLALPVSQYIYDQNFNQVEFLGTTCADVKSGALTPIVIFGCAGTGS